MSILALFTLVSLHGSVVSTCGLVDPGPESEKFIYHCSKFIDSDKESQAGIVQWIVTPSKDYDFPVINTGDFHLRVDPETGFWQSYYEMNI